MNLENKLLVSITAGFLNMLLSITIPCLIKNVKKPFMIKVRTVFNNNKKLILTSSLLISILVFLALSITDELNDMFENSVPSYNNYSDNSANTSQLFYSDNTQLMLESTDRNMFVEPGTNLPNVYNSNDTLPPMLSTSRISDTPSNEVLPSMLSSISNKPDGASPELISTLTNMLDSREGLKMATFEGNPNLMTTSVLPNKK